MRDFSGFNPETIFENYNLTPNPVDCLSFNNFFLEADVAQGMTFKGKFFGLFLVLTMKVDSGNTHVQKFHAWLSWYMMACKGFISIASFIFKN